MKKEEIHKKSSEFEIPQSYDVYELSTNEKIKYFLIAGSGLMFISFLFYHSVLLSLLFSLISYPCISIYRSYLKDKRKKELSEQFRDALYSISASISAGRQISEALREACENMKILYQEEAILVKEFSFMVNRIFESRESEEVILKDFARRSNMDDIIIFVDTFIICRATGGDLIKVVAKASEIMIDKMTIEKEISTVTAQKRFEAKILAAMPILVLLFLQIASPDYMQVMYDTLIGKVLMTLSLVAILTAYFWSIKLTSIDI